MQIGTKVQYTQRGYANDYIVKINNMSPTLTQINNIKEEEYSTRKGVIIAITKRGLYTVEWENVGGFFDDNISHLYNEDIKEVTQPLNHTRKTHMTITELDKFIRTLIGTTGRYRTLKRLSKHLPLDAHKKEITVYTDEGGCLNEYVLCGAYILRYETNPHTNKTEFFSEIEIEDVPSLTWYLQNIKGFLYPALEQWYGQPIQ